MSAPRATAVERHTLKFEGAPHDDQGRRMPKQGVGGTGRARCSCGEMSMDLSSVSQRNAWHHRHKHLERVKEFLTFESEGRAWPFTESERCDVTGFGHQDQEEFLAAVNDYDRIVGLVDEDDLFQDPGIVVRRYAIFEFPFDDVANIYTTVDGQRVSPDTHPECVPITTIWGQR